MKIKILKFTLEIEDSLFRFLIVGVLGTMMNMFIFYILADILHYDANFSSIIAFIIAVTQNYLINQTWSFKDANGKELSFRNYLKYLTVNIVGLLVNLLILNLILMIFNPSLKVIAQFFGILGGFVVDYIGSKFFVFLKKKKVEEINE